MIVTAIIFIVVAVWELLSYIAAVIYVNKLNKSATKFNKMHIKTSSTVRFYIALVVFAVLVGWVYER